MFLTKFLTMKNSVVLLPHFHVWCQAVVKIRQDDIYEKVGISVYTGISKISIFPEVI